uniref:Uncharacterized protein n=1 Tax=Hyaloperonospora arabidopsidis (strain Emoy2) TaxID=559515 RepID=M4BEY0_HYAAE
MVKRNRRAYSSQVTFLEIEMCENKSTPAKDFIDIFLPHAWTCAIPPATCYVQDLLQPSARSFFPLPSMAAEMEQHRAPELVLAYMLDESKPIGAPVDVLVNPRSELMWPASCPLQPKLVTSGDSNCKEGTTASSSFLSSFVPTPTSGYVGEEVLEESALPNPGHDLSSLSCDSVLPVSPRDLHLDSRYMANTWSYEAPQNISRLTDPYPILAFLRHPQQ